MSVLTVQHINGDTTIVRGVDGTRVIEPGVLQAMRREYSGGPSNPVKSMPLVNIKSWEVSDR